MQSHMQSVADSGNLVPDLLSCLSLNSNFASHMLSNGITLVLVRSFDSFEQMLNVPEAAQSDHKSA